MTQHKLNIKPGESLALNFTNPEGRDVGCVLVVKFTSDEAIRVFAHTISRCDDGECHVPLFELAPADRVVPTPEPDESIETLAQSFADIMGLTIIAVDESGFREVKPNPKKGTH